MGTFVKMQTDGHEQVVFCHDRYTGLRAVIAIHSTLLGPALGGCRMWTYAGEEDAVTDALRLARGMTYKNAAMGLNLGGGKAVIIGHPRQDKTEALMRAFGTFVHSLGGRYITAEDSGTTEADMALMRELTPYVVGVPGKSGDPSPATALGVYEGLKACAKEVYGIASLTGRSVAIQGLGSVGYHLAQRLHGDGARLMVTDIVPERVAAAVRDFNAHPVAVEAIYDSECDIFAPCALGAVINDDTLPRLRCRIVGGSANNQLAEDRHGRLLHELGIVYAPDFIINGGGVINVSEELHPDGYHQERAMAKIKLIGEKVGQILTVARERGIPPADAAMALTEERLQAAAAAKNDNPAYAWSGPTRSR